MCRAHHQATYSQVQSHSFGSNILWLLWHVRPGLYLPHTYIEFNITHAIILYNKMMCYAQHPVTYSKVQGHSVCPQFHNRTESTTCWNGFWYFYTQLFSITRWCVMHITKPHTPKFKVTVLAKKWSGFPDMSGLGCICNILTLNLILLTQLLSLAIWCVMHNTQSPTRKFKVTVWAQTVSVCNCMSGLKLPHAGMDFDIFTNNYSP